jgi:hypothetical protein
MNRLLSAKPVLAAAVAFAALAGATAAQARTDVALSIGIPFGYAQPQPVYVQPQPVYVQPQSYYYESQPYYQPYYQSAPVYVQPRVVHYNGHHRNGAWRDADRDGVPNRYDRAPNNPYRR